VIVSTQIHDPFWNCARLFFLFFINCARLLLTPEHKYSNSVCGRHALTPWLLEYSRICEHLYIASLARFCRRRVERVVSKLHTAQPPGKPNLGGKPPTLDNKGRSPLSSAEGMRRPSTSLMNYRTAKLSSHLSPNLIRYGYITGVREVRSWP